VVIYASLELGDERAPILAILLGLLLDLSLHDPHKLGTCMLMLGSLSTLIVSQAHRRESHHWIFRIIYVLIGTFAYQLVDYVFLLAETSRWYWPLDVWSKITFASLLNVILSPFLFLIVGFLPRRLGWRPDYETNDRLRAYA
jgi:rod shape-determining protein MreD